MLSVKITALVSKALTFSDSKFRTFEWSPTHSLSVNNCLIGNQNVC